jgi:HSP20 family protein
MFVRNRNPFGALWQELNQVQDEFNKWFARGGRASSVPTFNVWEDESAVFAEADLPGLDPGKIEVTITEGNKLTVQGERPATEIEGAVWIRQERPFGKFIRAITLPALVNAEQVEAKYENGVLRLRLPKHEAAKPRKIAVKGE